MRDVVAMTGTLERSDTDVYRLTNLDDETASLVSVSWTHVLIQTMADTPASGTFETRLAIVGATLELQVRKHATGQRTVVGEAWLGRVRT